VMTQIRSAKFLVIGAMLFPAAMANGQSAPSPHIYHVEVDCVTSSVTRSRNVFGLSARKAKSRATRSVVGQLRSTQKSPSFPGGAAGRMGLCCLVLESFGYDRGLPMSAAVTAAAVSAATTTVEAATTANRSAADCFMCSTAAEAADGAAPCEAGAATSESTAVEPTTSESATVKPAPETTSAEAAAEPRACSDEHATGEVARTVVTIRRAGIGVIPIVSVRADGSRADVPRTDAHADCDALSISVRR
jgi:hypothetical protein